MSGYDWLIGKRWRVGTLLLLLSIWTSYFVGCASERQLVVLPESSSVIFLEPGQTFQANRPLVVLDKGSYLLLVEAAGNSLGKEDQ